ncbi:MAG: hypothetical protein APF80_14975 [Alphaproteobacteria bacterium BRH_c36]|nr:MAG: hypothetical protein APF80_14975 [Alphaproteobacteria bacterium BRH_c36]
MLRLTRGGAVSGNVFVVVRRGDLSNSADRLDPVFGQRQLGDGHLILGSNLGLQQRADDLLGAMLAFDADRDDLVVGDPHANKLQRSHHLQDLRALHGKPPQRQLARQWRVPIPGPSGQ